MGIEIPSTADQGRVFRRLRLSLFRNGLRMALQSGRTRLFGTLATCLVVALFTFAVGMYLFDQMAKNKIPFKGLIVEALFDLLFFTLGSMLLFSTGIILFASLFTSPETRYLLSSPPRAVIISSSPSFSSADRLRFLGIRVILWHPRSFWPAAASSPAYRGTIIHCFPRSCSATFSCPDRCPLPSACCSCATCRGIAASSSP